jgi:hypothetical protein
MDLYLRAIFTFLALYWAVTLVRTLRKPPDWFLETPPEAPFNVRFTRTTWLAASVLGIAAAVVLFFVAPILVAQPD